MFVEEIRRQAETAPRAALPAIASAMWRAYAEGQITEAEAERLAAVIEARQSKTAKLADLRPPVSGGSTPTEGMVISAIPSDRQRSPRTGAGSRPRTDASLERRRRWAASGRLPPALAARFTLAEQAVLAMVAAETARRGDCRLAIEHLASVAGVSRSTVKAAIHEARKLGLLTVEERRLTGFRNDTNVVRIVSPEWVAWLRLARKGDPQSKSGSSAIRRGGGVKFSTCTPTRVSNQRKTRLHQPLKSGIAVPISPSLLRSRKADA